MLSVELPNGLNGASLIQHSTLNIQHYIFVPLIGQKYSTFAIVLDNIG